MTSDTGTGPRSCTYHFATVALLRLPDVVYSLDTRSKGQEDSCPRLRLLALAILVLKEPNIISKS